MKPTHILTWRLADDMWVCYAVLTDKTILQSEVKKQEDGGWGATFFVASGEVSSVKNLKSSHACKEWSDALAVRSKIVLEAAAGGYVESEE